MGVGRQGRRTAASGVGCRCARRARRIGKDLRQDLQDGQDFGGGRILTGRQFNYESSEWHERGRDRPKTFDRIYRMDRMGKGFTQRRGDAEGRG